MTDKVRAVRVAGETVGVVDPLGWAVERIMQAVEEFELALRREIDDAIEEAIKSTTTRKR